MLHPTATVEVINAVYRQLAKQHHPDHAGPAGQKRMAADQRGLRRPEQRGRIGPATTSASACQHASRRDPSDPSAPGRHDAQVRGWRLVRTRCRRSHASQLFALRRSRPAAPYPLPRGSVLSFGRYRGWAISQVVAHDRNYVEWLSRTMVGMSYRAELDQVLRQTPA